MIYFVTPDHRLKKIRGSDGHVVFDVPVAGQTIVFPGWNAVLAGPIVAVGKVDIFAFDTTSGAPRWTYVAPDLEETGRAGLVSDGSTIYAAGLTGRVHAIDATTGAARWVADLREGRDDIGSLNPTYSDGSVYVCTRSAFTNPALGTIWALDAATGAVRWLHRIHAELPQQEETCYGHVAVWNDLVIAPQLDGRIFALDETSGEIRWIAPRVHDVAHSLGDMRLPAVAGNTLLVTNSSLPSMIVAYDPATGTERWRNGHGGGSLFPPEMDETTAYVDHGYIFASYDLATGKLRWQTRENFSIPDPPIMGRAIIADDRIFVAGRDGSYALRR